MTKGKSEKILRRLKQHYGSPEAGLRYNSIYELTVSVILSAQTTDRQVNSVTPELFIRFPDFRSLSGASLPEVERIIKSTGFYRNKAKNIVRLSKMIVKKFSGRVPDSREELVSLPGIGRKSANVILSVGYNMPAFAVDTHVIRIANRVGYIQSNDPLKVENAATRYIPESEWGTAHLLMIKHGRTICSARKPLCPECPISSLCDYAGSNP